MAKKKASMMDSILKYETEGLEEQEEVKMFQEAINSGLAWGMQGSYGRQAMAYIEEGKCVLGKEGHRDYYGNYVPSRFEVKAGTKGSVQYANDRGYSVLE